ncbi:hypothetical protein B566_EDAN010202 [Ephemera danica]|nr:hypothetical protein B566_EDAN010202 [Ephemera danica]
MPPAAGGRMAHHNLHNKLEGRDEIVKQGLMIKRSQNKKRFTPVNYKQRWFVLSRQFLVYYDYTDGEDSLRAAVQPLGKPASTTSVSAAACSTLAELPCLHLLLTR